MLNTNKQDIANIMLNEFEKQFNNIFDGYNQKKYSAERAIKEINLLRNSWNVARLDIKNNGQHNQLALFNYTDGVRVSFPGWYSDERGQGAQLRLSKMESHISFCCINKGRVKFIFRGIDYRHQNKRIPVYLNYTNIKLNGVELLNKDKLAWHDDAFIYEMNCENNEKINLEVKCENIYTYFPLLMPYLLNIINKDDLESARDNILEYIDEEKKIVHLNDNRSDSVESVQMQLSLLKERNEELFFELEEYKKQTNKVLDSYNYLFNNLFKFNEVKPKKIVKLSRELNMQLLDFIDNVCKKHNLQWWLYAGSLLGAVRHQGFIPWDDDCDIKMMREDYEKFFIIIDNEIKEHNLSGFMEANTTTKTFDGVLLPFIKLNYWVDKHLYAFIDIFPTEYLKEEKPNIKTLFEVETNRMVGRLLAGEDRQIVIEDASNKMGVSKTKTNKIICGIEDAILAIHDYDSIFPLTKIPFENREYPCPKNYLTYLKVLYGENYMQIPKVIYDHGFYDYLSYHKDVHKKMEEEIKKLEKINNNF